jgi:hypothetical protein
MSKDAPPYDPAAFAKFIGFNYHGDPQELKILGKGEQWMEFHILTSDPDGWPLIQVWGLWSDGTWTCPPADFCSPTYRPPFPAGYRFIVPGGADKTKSGYKQYPTGTVLVWDPSQGFVDSGEKDQVALFEARKPTEAEYQAKVFRDVMSGELRPGKQGWDAGAPAPQTYAEYLASGSTEDDVPTNVCSQSGFLAPTNVWYNKGDVMGRPGQQPATSVTSLDPESALRAAALVYAAATKA